MEERIIPVQEAMKGIFKAIENLTNAEAICVLETAKIDIMLNDGIVVLGDKAGKDMTEKFKQIKR